ncbi:zinc finger protein 423-like [Trichogramma pretiosum]|uniref:zinc finger protein 423-like n=1 Tax=Trichogramma pretiosum TaxID=7493 RepID=UPI000C71B1C9|nr:zinc finger protein 423-like [Trichogramma pretiosum]
MSANAENLSENVIECKANVKLVGRKNKNSHASLTVYCSTCNSIMEYVARKTKRICRICHDEMRFPCPRCRRLYKEMKHLRQHMRYGCNSEPSFQCSECACKFTRKGSLVQHVKLKHTSYRHKTNDDDVDGKNIEKDDSDTEFEKLQESFARDLKSHKRVKKVVKKQQIQKAKSCSLKIELVRCDTDPKLRKSDDDSSRSSFNGNITKSITHATFTNETSRAHGDIGLSTDPSDWESSAPVFHFCIQCRFISRPTGESWIPTIKYCAHCNICMHYLCSGCDRIIDTPEVLRRHMRSRCSEPSGLPASQIYGRRSCRGCGGYFDALEEHEANCRPNQTGKCDLCDVQIGSLDELKKHIAMSTDPQTNNSELSVTNEQSFWIKCTTCPNSIVTDLYAYNKQIFSDFRRNICACSSKTKYKFECFQCRDYFKRYRDIRKHLADSCPGNPIEFCCIDCSFSTHKKYELSAHITNKHEESHHCKYCGSMVANNRMEHTMYCQNRPKIVCSLCDFYSFQEEKLRDHVQQFHL